MEIHTPASFSCSLKSLHNKTLKSNKKSDLGLRSLPHTAATSHTWLLRSTRTEMR